MPTDIGRKIANYRRANDITIKELADRTGLSSALISQLERGIGNPTIGALSSLAEAMEITLPELVAGQIENQSLICRKEDWVPVRQEGALLLRSVLVENSLNTSLSVMMLELQPHTYSNEGFEVHVEEECLFIMQGDLVVMFENEEFLLNEGDSIRILPNRLHSVRNDSDALAVAMNIKCKVQY